MRTALVLSACLIAATVTLAQTQKSLSPFEQELVNTETQFTQALVEKNVAFVKNAVADDFRGIATNGEFYDKDELVAEAQGGVPKDFRIYEIRVVQLDENSAVVAFNLIVPGGRPRYRHMTHTWTKQNGQWKLKFQQTTPNLWSATDLD